MRFTVTLLSVVCMMITLSLPALSQTNVTTTTGGFSGKIPKFTGFSSIETSIMSEVGSDSILVNAGGTSTLDTDCDYSAVLAGHNNDTTHGSDYTTTAGGSSNTLYDSDYCFVGGGYNNDMTWGWASFIGGGHSNTLTDGNYYCVIGGGYDNDMSTDVAYSVITGGRENDISNSYDTVGGGRLNVASGPYATVPGGYYNWAYGEKSFAAGSLATALHDGSFVWADSDSACSSSATDQFRVCADGGVLFSLDGAQVYVDGTVQADDFIEYSPYPENLEEAYASVMSVQRLPDGEYNRDDTRSQMDHSMLHTFVRRESPEGIGCSLSALVSSQNEVIKDYAERIAELEAKVESLRQECAR